MDKERVLREAEFNPNVRSYTLITGIFVLFVTVVGIPLIPVWLIVGRSIAQRQIDRMSCILTDRSLKMKKGIFTRIEKTIPLDKITDVGVIQGPLMRYYGIEALSVETAGQSNVGALLNLVGVQDGPAFRDAVLAQRDQVTANSNVTAPASPASATADTTLLAEIRDTLLRIERKLNE